MKALITGINGLLIRKIFMGCEDIFYSEFVIIPKLSGGKVFYSLEKVNGNHHSGWEERKIIDIFSSKEGAKEELEKIKRYSNV